MPPRLCLFALGLSLPAIQAGASPLLPGAAEPVLVPWLESAVESTAAFGPWPEEVWNIQLHDSDTGFERETRAPASRYGLWIGSTLHLRPWLKLQRRDLGALLRHELTHRRLKAQALSRWKEEAICLWAEGHTRLPEAWPEEPGRELQKRLDAALEAGTTESQRWAYAWLRAWIGGRPLPRPAPAATPRGDGWQAEDPEAPIRVVWPPERLPRRLSVNGLDCSWKPSVRVHFEGVAQFGAGMPLSRLEGRVDLEAAQNGWRLTWTTTRGTWIAAAVEGELGRAAPFEAKRALAAVLGLWLKAHPAGNHLDGTFCPLTHCAVIRGQPTPEGLEAAARAPFLPLAPERAFFTGSAGGVSWSPREAWGGGSLLAGTVQRVPGDPWGTWTRVLTASQVRQLKASVRPGLRLGQRGIRLGPSGPYPVEALRLTAGRRFGWTTWPSNACEAEPRPDGSLILRGYGWGHNVGLCLATTLFRAKRGDRAEEILLDAFGSTDHPLGEGAEPAESSP